MSRKKRTDTPSYVVASGAVLGAAAGIFVGSPSLLSSGFTGSVLFMVVPNLLPVNELGPVRSALLGLTTYWQGFVADNGSPSPVGISHTAGLEVTVIL